MALYFLTLRTIKSTHKKTHLLVAHYLLTKHITLFFCSSPCNDLHIYILWWERTSYLPCQVNQRQQAIFNLEWRVKFDDGTQCILSWSLFPTTMQYAGLCKVSAIFHFIYSFQPLRPFKAHFWHAWTIATITIIMLNSKPFKVIWELLPPQKTFRRKQQPTK